MPQTLCKGFVLYHVVLEESQEWGCVHVCTHVSVCVFSAAEGVYRLAYVKQALYLF